MTEYDFEFATIQFGVAMPFEEVIERLRNKGEKPKTFFQMDGITVKADVTCFRTSEGYFVRITQQGAVPLTLVSILASVNGERIDDQLRPLRERTGIIRNAITGA